MSALRKLQSEIDKTLKKLDEGIGVFEDLWDKLHATDHQSQKEKCENELKKEIKKLQRMREQLKTWSTHPEIKDKTSLAEGRKRVERKMEQFKVLEREMKTRAFSNEGLSRAGDDDPRSEMREWLNDTCERLNEEADVFEAEVEAETARPRKSQDAARISRLEESTRRHKEHVHRLEQCLRCLDKDDITTEEVEGVKMMVEDYLERGQEDFEEFGDVDVTYEAIVDRLSAVARDTVTTGTPEEEARAAEEKAQEEKMRRERERAAAQAAKAELAGSRSQEGQPTSGSTLAAAGTPKKTAKATPASQQSVGSQGKEDEGAAAAGAVAAMGKAPGTAAEADAVAARVDKMAIGPEGAAVAGGGLAPGGAAPGGPGDAQGQAQAGAKGPAAAALPSAPLLLPTAQAARQSLQILQEVFAIGVPQPQDSEWLARPPRQQQPAQGLPASYPTKKLPLVDQPALYERLDPEALFFAFYFQPGRYQQYLAAKELKRQSWRFHTKHKAWFQRHDCPAEITDEFERGSYVYFDYNVARDSAGEGGWCYRVKQDFKIDYNSLENQL